MTPTRPSRDRPSSTVPGLGYRKLPQLIGRMTGDEKHESSTFSTLDVIWVLYDRVLRVSPASASDPARDRFLLSKGHGPMAYYAILAAKGFFPADWLASFGRYDSRLGGHPDRMLVPGVEISSGSLGHGLPMALGLAFGLSGRAETATARTFCLVGDAELDEGSNHEAIALAGHLGLESLHVVAIDNRSATYGWPGGIAARFALEGWATVVVDGRDHAAIESAFAVPHPSRPLAVVAEVVEGRART
jgi:transketolase